jgi:hypothetical protein
VPEKRFQDGDVVMDRVTGLTLGKVLSTTGKVVLVETGDGEGVNKYERDLTLLRGVDEPAATVSDGEQAFVAGDLCSRRGGLMRSAGEVEVLVGPEHKLVWVSAKQDQSTGTPGQTRVELHRLDGSYVTTVALSKHAITPAIVQLAMEHIVPTYLTPPRYLDASSLFHEEGRRGD